MQVADAVAGESAHPVRQAAIETDVCFQIIPRDTQKRLQAGAHPPLGPSAVGNILRPAEWLLQARVAGPL